MIFTYKTVGSALIFLMLYSSAHAQLCKEDTSAGMGALPCDMTMRDALLTCDKHTAAGSCPSKPMPTIQTPLKSYIKDYSPYLYYTLPDTKDKNVPYDGTYYRGTAGEKDIALKEFGNTPTGQKTIASCVPQIKLKSDATSKEDMAKLARLQMDNCANQFILNASLSPVQRANATLPSGDNPNDPAELVKPEFYCQPLKMAPVTEEEYIASDYIKGAWKKLLNDPKYVMNTDAQSEPKDTQKEPTLPEGVTLENTDKEPTKQPSPFPEVKLASLAASKFEEIYDPSHPFSPRWDFKWNERDHYSPKTAAYGGDTKNGVFCAGDKKDKIIKVDILSFRDKTLKFDQHLTDRIDYNAKCDKNEGAQAYPCCRLDPIPKPPWVKCTKLDCKTCYEMSAQSPVCSTDYTGTPDRKSVIKTNSGRPVFPVPPWLRIEGFGSAVTGMALSKINAATPVGAVQAAMGGQLNMLRAVANANLSPAGIQSMLSGQVNVLAKLPIGNLSNITNLANISGIISMPQSMLSRMSGLGIGQAQSLLGGQLNIMSTLNGLGGGKLNINASLSSLGSVTQMFSSLGTTGKTLGDIQHLLGGQTNILASLNTNLPIGQAISGLNAANSLMNSLSSGQTLGSIQGLLRGQITSLSGMGVNMTVGGATNIINSQLQQFTNISATARLGDVLTKVNISSGLSGLRSLPANTPMGDVRAILNAQLVGMADHSSNAPLSTFTTILSSNTAQILTMPGSTPVGDVRVMISGLTGGITNLGATMQLSQLSQIPTMMTDLTKTFAGMDQSLPLGSIAPMVDSLKGGIANIAGLNANIPLGDINNIMQSQIGGMLNIPNIGKLLPSELGNVLGAQAGLVNDIGKLAGNLTGSLNGAMSSVTGALSQVTGAMTAQISNITGALTSSINGALGGITSGISGAMGTITGTMGNQLAMLQQYSPSALMGSVAGKIDSAVMANAPGVSQVLDEIQLAKVVAGLNYPRTAKCTPDELTDNNPSMTSLCKDLRRPVAMVNKLKMRYHNPEDKDNIVLTEGVQKGLTFKDHFDDHMPYPRLWDTGTSIQKNPPSDLKFQEPMDTSGQYTAIVGVGHEATPKSVTDPDKMRKDERCLSGGWGGDVNFGGVSIKESDPVTSWTELKLYQARTYRNWGLACLGRYDKAFKPGSTENVLLAQAGAEWSSIVVTKCPKKSDGTVDTDNCKYLSYKEAQNDGGAGATNGSGDGATATSGDSGDSGATGSNGTSKTISYKQASFPLAWRGYLSAKDEKNQFPNFGGGSPSLKTGLDSADLGDIIIFSKGSGKSDDKLGLPKVAKVSKVFRCDQSTNCSMEITEVDNGKFPDVCGTTDSWGEVKTRTIYKPGKMPSNISSDLARISSTTGCEDTKLSQCELADWDKVQYYRIADDVRKGCDKINASECK